MEDKYKIRQFNSIKSSSAVHDCNNFNKKYFVFNKNPVAHYALNAYKIKQLTKDDQFFIKIK